MLDGKKSVAHRVFYDAMDRIEKKITDAPPNEVFETALSNIKPEIEVRSKRVGGANYQVPMQVNPKRRQSLAIRWLLAATRKKAGRPMSHRLADELMAAYRKEGDAMQQREMVHRMADANKAFAHFAWGR
jgi:small subunit ribosomal protein S7